MSVESMMRAKQTEPTNAGLLDWFTPGLKGIDPDHYRLRGFRTRTVKWPYSVVQGVYRITSPTGGENITRVHLSPETWAVVETIGQVLKGDKWVPIAEREDAKLIRGGAVSVATPQPWRILGTIFMVGREAEETLATSIKAATCREVKTVDGTVVGFTFPGIEFIGTDGEGRSWLIY